MSKVSEHNLQLIFGGWISHATIDSLLNQRFCHKFCILLDIAFPYYHPFVHPFNFDHLLSWLKFSNIIFNFLKVPLWYLSFLFWGCPLQAEDFLWSFFYLLSFIRQFGSTTPTGSDKSISVWLTNPNQLIECFVTHHQL